MAFIITRQKPHRRVKTSPSTVSSLFMPIVILGMLISCSFKNINIL